MNELLRILHSRGIQKTTFDSHVNVYKKIEGLLNGRPFASLTYPDILDILHHPIVMELSNSYKRKILSLFIVVFEELKKEAITAMNETDVVRYLSNLDKIRELFKSLASDIVTERIQKFASKNTDQYADILRYIFSVEVAQYPKRFIVNYLVFFLNTRNLDLYAKVILHTDMGIMDTSINSQEGRSPAANYLVIHPDYTEFIRNTYKTAPKYNQKISIITDVVFNTLIKHMPLNEWLLTGNTNSLGSLVQSHLYNGMSETDYLKNNVSHFKNDINKLFQIQNNRGTNLQTLMSSYNKDYDNKKYAT